MIVRLVKLTIQPEKVQEFHSLFLSVEEKIKNSHGCMELILYNDIKTTNTFFTYSIWNTEADLQLYRDSELFLSIWTVTKTYFAEPAEAWSLV